MVVDSFVDNGAGLVLSMWFVLAISLEKQAANNVMYDESFTRVKRLLTKRLHGKATEHS